MVNSQRYLRVMVLLGALLWSSLSFAAYDASTCDNLTSTKDFGIYFSIDNARLTETVNALKGEGSDTKATVSLWSNDSTVFSPVIRDGVTQVNGSYEVWLKYQASNDTNKTGLLSYYLLTDGQWKLISADQEADLRDIKSVHVKVTNVGVNEMVCGNTATPPPITPTFEKCEYFPGPLQGNRYNAQKPWASTLSISGGSGKGNRIYLDNGYVIPFATLQYNSNNPNNNPGEGNGCVYGSSAPDSSTTPTMCMIDSEAIVFGGNPPLPKTFTTNGQAITVPDNNANSPMVLNAGEYKSITFGINGSTLMLSSGEYWVEALNMKNNNAQLKVNGKVILHYNTISVSGNSIQINAQGSADDLNIIGHGESSSLILNNANDFTVTANWYISPEVSASGIDANNVARFHYTGAISTPFLYFRASDESWINATGISLCDTSPPDSDYQLVLQPAEAYVLICEDQRIEFQVVDNNNQATGDFTGTISVSPASASLALVQGKGSGSNGSYTPNENGELWLDLTASSSQTVTITGTLNPQGDSASVSGTYHFVPYKLSASDQYVIANKPQTVEVKALACDDNGGVVDINYGGTPTVSSAWVAPTSGAGELNFAPAFTQGGASSELTMEDSGIKTVIMTDSSFDCSGLTDCPVEGSGTLQGSFTVYSRPWTLAICSPNGNTMDGDITNPDSLAFTKAGNLFALNIRPLRWVSSSGDDSSPQAGGSAIETSAYCSSAVTQNFFSDNSQLAALAVLSHQVAQPADGNDGTLDGTLEQLNTTGINSTYLPFSGVSWSEVGVLRVNADISGSYLGMTVNQGYRDIGRFYPAWLSITENSWDYADDQNGFVYMNQTIPYRFTVEAQNMQSDATTNYSAFSQALIADVKLLAVDSDGEELSDRIDEYDLQLWDGAGDGAWSGATLSVSNDFTFLKQQQSASPYTSSVDGPYQSGFGLRVSDKVDGVDFVSPDLELKASTTLLDTGKRFTTQPDIRYGRMVLGDVGGTSVSTINVPLRVEYWQGNRFAINADDSGSYFATPNEYVCKQTVWPTSGSGSSSKLIGSDTSSSWAKVASGKSSVVFATPASSDETADVREQVRFWLRLDDDARSSPQLSESGVNCGTQYTSQPWLQYNWRDKGDEDPSAVVTFGIHRGNDKVIFRGETRLTGQ
ncbi:DUF6701 domain-containing protein [Vibrio fluvialis]|uniref:DUF6701 domain-containing protein n=1 Tax=Vibrio fluvialis TaxID=676 RepID=UPI002572799A|nr:DUF6701 domain-containing protein [Vibrio fluvialis]BEI21971.1 hypothetical protein KKIDH5335_03030 [Vibrio fluvialis]